MTAPRPYKILHLDSERTWRGGQQQVFLLARGLRERGHHSTVVCPPGSPLAERCAEVGLRVVPILMRGEWDLSAVFKIRQILSGRTVHVLHAHSAHAAALGAWSRNPALRGFVISRRVDFPIAKNIFSRWKYDRADKILAISQGVKKILLEDGILEQKIAVVPSGLDLSVYSRVSPKSWAEWKINPSAPVVGIVAALAPHKDHKNFLRAAQKVKKQRPDVRFLVVGDGPLRQELLSLRRTLQLDNEVLFTGFRRDALEILASLTLVVLSSATEGMGTVLLEAMALGRPIVATATGGIPEVVEEGKNGFLVAPRDPEALAQGILRLVQDPALAQRLGQGGRVKVQDFSVERTVEKTELLYQELISRGFPVAA